MKLTAILAIVTIALSAHLPVVAQEATTKPIFGTVKLPKVLQPTTVEIATKRTNTVKVPRNIQPPTENREYRITGVTLQLVSLRACKQFQEGMGMKTVKTTIVNTIVARQEDLSIKDAHRLTSIIAQNAQAECGQLGSND